MKTLAFVSAAALAAALGATGAKAGEFGYGYGPSTTYTYSETRYGGGYRDVGYDEVPAYRTRRVVREVYDAPRRPYSWGGPQFRGYAVTGPHYRSVDLDDED